ncbi:response regulator transcription factor [Alloalcanivorax profundimaris]|uniref:response regulator transcription factor n=1 Tax=Alloalcanivorax profundimaris TaxID=2735259 RepID=UPI000C4EB1EF|nr:response regulator transcription factor [Alloalcanivorax profundimaris]MAO61116.1 DNA-binding response regulator [Alcanivorax sp.]MBM1142995.1 response regulator transcription factor [Alcanivorax sp. ZXX171]UWN51488.1 Transcriptional regulatory protein QseB [Alcanivorax sp. ALC70]MBF1803639.1 response regulator transcription factor [Alloalcanivorax profundimaris]MBU58058.1 DNA-binding response regulator [Alcanivorax sp.]|tara:strand:+ start:31572 stop:32243 length:672 start_codon:yes stop_codon:yes gene_type:complete
MRLLLVEDSVDLADQLMPMLRDNGYAVDWLADGRDALVRAHDEPFDLAILDLGLPGLDGLEVLRRWRDEGLAMPVLILTARDSWAERVDGLRAGADDYLTKPFHPDELLLRVQAVLRRSHGSSGGGRLEAGGLALDEARQSVWDGDREMELTGAEFRMLRYFMLNPDRLLSKAALTEHLYDGESERDSNVVEVHVNRLRRKLGRDTIQTRRGQGYLFVGHGAA